MLYSGFNVNDTSRKFIKCLSPGEIANDRFPSGLYKSRFVEGVSKLNLLEFDE